MISKEDLRNFLLEIRNDLFEELDSNESDFTEKEILLFKQGVCTMFDEVIKITE